MKDTFGLKNITRLASAIALLLSVYHFVKVCPSIMDNMEMDLPDKIKEFARLFVRSGLGTMALFISFKGKESKGAALFALFLVALVLNDGWFYEGLLGNQYLELIIVALETALTATLFINTVQFFPKPISPENVYANIRLKVLSYYLVFLLRPRNLWSCFFPIVFIIAIGCFLLNISIFWVNLMIIFTGLGYMFLSYRKFGINSRSSILWMFWGVLCYIILVIFSAILHAFNPVANAYISLLISLMSQLIILITVFMSVFFADSFDTGIIIKRTIVDGLLFLLVILTYNVIEHYLLHTINHTLHINDAFLSSLLSGIMVLVISPVHHRLMAFLNKKLKQDQGEAHQH